MSTSSARMRSITERRVAGNGITRQAYRSRLPTLNAEPAEPAEPIIYSASFANSAFDRRSLRGRIELHHAEQRAFGISEIRRPADAGHRPFRNRLPSARRRHRPRDLLHRVAGDDVGRRLAGLLTARQAAVDPGTLARLDHPVIHRPVPFLETPAEGLLVERHTPRRIVGGQLEMHNPHRPLRRSINRGMMI